MVWCEKSRNMVIIKREKKKQRWQQKVGQIVAKWGFGWSKECRMIEWVVLSARWGLHNWIKDFNIARKILEKPFKRKEKLKTKMKDDRDYERMRTQSFTSEAVSTWKHSVISHLQESCSFPSMFICSTPLAFLQQLQSQLVLYNSTMVSRP